MLEDSRAGLVVVADHNSGHDFDSGHHIAQQAPDQLARALSVFLATASV